MNKSDTGLVLQKEIITITSIFINEVIPILIWNKSSSIFSCCYSSALSTTTTTTSISTTILSSLTVLWSLPCTLIWSQFFLIRNVIEVSLLDDNISLHLCLTFLNPHIHISCIRSVKIYKYNHYSIASDHKLKMLLIYIEQLYLTSS